MNLLTDPLIRTVTEKGMVHLNLPALLFRLGQNDVHHFPGIQRHQIDAFHVFLCYLAGAVLARSNDTSPVKQESFWLKELLNLAGDAGADAWRLLSNSDSEPAFMQPPLPGNTQRPTSKIETPDQLDLLVTAKNHDVKRNRAALSEIDTWLYALISLQTMSGFSGRGNHGISRMNSGYGNRAIVELSREQKPGQRWIDTVVRLSEHRKQTLKEPFGFDPGGLVLVWLLPWDGDNPLELSKLDPFYIEICRRVRLRGRNYVEHAEFYPSKQPRISAKELSGVVGDPWLPVELKGINLKKPSGIKALTFPPTGITAEHMRRLIFEDELKLSILQKPGADWKGDLWLTISVLVRGQGITDGFHSWEVRIPEKKTMSIFSNPTERDALEKLSRSAISSAATMQHRILKPSVFTYALGAPERFDFDDPFGNSVWTRASRHFETLWSLEYFPWLFSVPELFDDLEELRRWVKIMQDIALKVLREIELSVANHSGRHYRMRTEARSRFWGGFYKNFDFMRRDHIEICANSAGDS